MPTATVRSCAALICRAALVTLLCGCSDPEAVRREAAYKQADEAIDKLIQAQQSGGTDQARLDQMADAAKELQKVVDSGALPDPTQAHQVLAMVDQSAALQLSRDAQSSLTTLIPEQADLISLALAMSWARTRADALKPHHDQLITSLAKYENDKKAEQDQFRQEKTQLEQTVKALSERIDKLTRERDEARARQQDLTAQSAKARGEEALKLGQQAVAQAQQANRLENSVRNDADPNSFDGIESLNDQRDLAKQNLSLLDLKIAQCDAAIQHVKQQATFTQSGAEKQSTGRTQILGNAPPPESYSWATSEAEFKKKYAEIAAAYATSVKAPLDQAADKMTAAVNHLRQAMARPGSSRDIIRENLAAAQTSQVELLVQAILASERRRQVLETISQYADVKADLLATANAEAEMIERTTKTLVEAYTSVIQLASPSATAATTQAADGASKVTFSNAAVTKKDDAIYQAAAAFIQALNTARDQIIHVQTKLNKPPLSVSPPTF